MNMFKSLLFALAILPHCASAAFTAPTSGVSQSNTFTISWDWDPIIGPGMSNNAPTYLVYERDLNRGTSGSMSLFSKSVTRTKTPSRYEYEVRPWMCISSGCYHYSPPGNKMVIAVGEDAIPVAKPAEPVNAIGTIPYQVDVNNKGEGTVSIPIEVLPGINGMQPALSINYSSGGTTAKMRDQTAEGLLGFGWGLSGLSTIHRCTVGKPDVQGYISTYHPEWGTQPMRPKLKYDNTDNLCLDGELLVLVSGTHLQHLAEYRTYRESFKKITLLQYGSDPYFVVNNPDGSSAKYGTAVNSRVQKKKTYGSSSLTPIFIWGMDQVEDSFGNTVNYYYRKWEAFSYQANRQRLYPTTISYAGETIKFEYITLDHPSVIGSVAGDDGSSAGPDRWRSSDNSGDQIVSISTSTKKYNLLDTGQTVSNMRSHGYKMSGIQVCGAASYNNYSSCLPPITFEWLTRTTQYPEYPQMTSKYYEVGFLGGITDTLGKKTSFQYDKIYGWQSDNKQNQFSEYPLTLPAASNLQGSYNRTHGTKAADNLNEVGFVVVQLKRDTGISSTPHVTKYQYRASGTVSSYGRGFLGFPAIRTQDMATGIFSYFQYEIDKSTYGPIGLIGDLSAVHTYNSVYGSGVVPFNKMETRHGLKTFTYANGAKTYLPIVDQITEMSYESGSLISATIKTNTYQISSGTNFITKLVSKTKIGSKLASLSHQPQYWAHNAPYTLDSAYVKSEAVTETVLGNSSGSGDYRIGYTTSTENTHYNGAAGSAQTTDIKTKKRTFTVKPGTTKVATEVHFPGDPDYEKTISYTYDSQGRQLTETISGANIETRTVQTLDHYSSTEIPERTINPLGHIITVSDFDVRHDLPQRIIDENNRTTIIYYDAFGRHSFKSDIDGVATNISYQSCDVSYCEPVSGKLGNITPIFFKETESQIAPRVREYYDALGRIIRHEETGFDGIMIRRDTQYDELGRVYKSSLPYKAATTAYFEQRTYDIRSRITRIDNPDGGYTTTTYSVENVGGNEVMQKVSTLSPVKVPGGSVLSFSRKSNVFDATGKPIKTVSAETTSEVTTTTFTYDALGYLHQSAVDGGSAGTTTVTTVYDHAGNLISETDPNTGTKTYAYTALHEIREMTDALGNTVTNSYDKLGRIKLRVSPDGTDNWFYDLSNAKGQINYVTNSNGYKRNYYYTAGRLDRTKLTVTIPGLAVQTFEESYTRDDFGRLQTLTYPMGLEVTHEYNAYGYPSGTKRGANGVTLSLIKKLGAFGIEEEELAGSLTKRSFDPQSGRPQSINSSHGSVVQNVTYQWYTNGSLEGKTNLSKNLRDKFTYDNHDRLLSTETSTASTGAIQRTLLQQFNSLGNLTSKTSSNSSDLQVTGYQYDSSVNAGPHAVSSVNIKGVNYTLHYNANGAVTKYDAASGNDKHISYNAFNQPLAITVGASATTSNPVAREEFRYAPDGTRYYKKSTYEEGGVLKTEHTYYFGSSETTIYEANTLARSEKVQHGRLLVIKNTTTSGAVSELIKVLHMDYQGSIEAITNGSATTALAFEPFGHRRNPNLLSNITVAQESSLLTSMSQLTSDGYTGHEMLDRVGLIHMNGRVYDPHIGRFLSPDPIVQLAANSQNWNRYSYVLNNPMKYVDPSGYTAVEEVHVPGTRCDEKCQRQGQYDAFLSILLMANTSTQTWETVGNMAYNIADIQGMVQYVVAQSLQGAGGGSKTNKNTILSILAMAGSIPSIAQEGLEPQPTSPLIPPEHQTQMDVFARLASEARDTVDANCSWFCKLPWIRGSKIHKEFAVKVQMMNLMNPNYNAEVSYIDGEVVRYGMIGSVRADAIYGLPSRPHFAVELKTGFAQMTRLEYQRYKDNLPPGVPVYGISTF